MPVSRAPAALLLAFVLSGAGWAQAGGREESDRAPPPVGYDRAMPRVAALSSRSRGEGVVRRQTPTIKLSQTKFQRRQLKEAKDLSKRAKQHIKRGRPAEAEPLIKRALAIKEGAFGQDDYRVAESLNFLAKLYKIQGRYDEAEPLLKRALAIKEREFGTEHPRVAKSLDTLSQLYWAQGRYNEAEPLVRRALAIWEQARGRDHKKVAGSLNNLAALYRAQGRYAEAESLVKRALAIHEKAQRTDHPRVANTLNNLATLYRIQRRYDEAEPLVKRALAIWEKARGPDHRKVAGSLNNLARLYRAQGRDAEAEPLVKRALAIWEKAFGPDHPAVAKALATLASIYRKRGSYAAAEPHLERALAIAEGALGPDHPSLAKILTDLAAIYKKQRRHAEALDHIRRATNIRRSRATRSGEQRSVGDISEQKKVRLHFLSHVKYVAHAIERAPERQDLLLAESFEVGQLAQATSAAAAVSGMAARFAAGDDDLAVTVRARQDAVERWRFLDALLVEAAGASPEDRDAKGEARLRSEVTTLEQRIHDLDARLGGEFPEYTELANPRPLSIAEVQNLLAPGEALMTYVVGKQITFLWVVRRDRAAIHRLPIGGQELADAVAALRAGLDQTGLRNLGDVKGFDVEEAFTLY